MKTHIRCPWANPQNPLYLAYHDTEWGVPVHDDRTHFEFLILEGAQAGLSWETVLNKRATYKTIFHNFDAGRVAAMTDDELATALQNPGIIRNKLKVFAARKNAQVFLNIQKEFGSFDVYVWRFIGNSPRFNSWSTLPEIPTSTPESDALSKDLKKRGMTFVGSTIMYAYMQAVGLVNDHLRSCWKYTKPPLAV
jgi:DNA-3-methyladenine glycosylase I